MNNGEPSFGAAAFGLSEDRVNELTEIITKPFRTHDSAIQKLGTEKGWHGVYLDFVKPLAKTHEEELYCAYVLGSIKTGQSMESKVDNSAKMLSVLIKAMHAGVDIKLLLGMLTDEEE